MATRSIITTKNGSGKYTTTYCHYDGYPEYMGAILKEYYSLPEQALAVSSVGYLSQVLEDLNESIEKSANKFEPELFDSIQEVVENADASGCHYVWLFHKGKWMYKAIVRS